MTTQILESEILENIWRFSCQTCLGRISQRIQQDVRDDIGFYHATDVKKGQKQEQYKHLRKEQRGHTVYEEDAKEDINLEK